MLRFESMTYGSESECATHYTTAHHIVIGLLFETVRQITNYVLNQSRNPIAKLIVMQHVKHRTIIGIY